MRRRGEKGFTLIEVLVTTLILVVVLAAASSLFVNLMRAYKQQSKIAETGMEGILGLEILRQDIQHAGFGLPWNAVTIVGEATTGVNPMACNPGATTDPPRAIGSLAAVGPFGASDYLVVRAANLGTATACKKWTTLRLGTVTRNWGSPLEDLASTDRVVVLSPGLDNSSYRTLVKNGAVFHTTFGNLSAFAPPDDGPTYIVYGIAGADTLTPRMPFNRADYYVDNTSVPVHCADDTGVLVKAVLSQDNGVLMPPLPLLDCVASVKYRYGLDTNGDGLVDVTADAAGLAGKTAAQIRSEVKDVQVFILAHEGQRDDRYVHPTAADNTVNVAGTNVKVDRQFRWRLYSLTVQPISLRD